MAKPYIKRWPKNRAFDQEWLKRWVIEIPISGCWIWEGTLNPGGYGSVGYNGKLNWHTEYLTC